MSEYTLSGVDFTNGKRVNQVFDFSDDLLNINKSGGFLEPEGGSSSLFDTTKIAEDLTKKSKKVDKKNKSNSSVEKVEEFIDKVERPKNFKTLKDIEDFYGVGLDTPIADFDGLTVNQLKESLGHSDLPEGTEVYQGGFLDPVKKGTILDKDRPKGIFRPLASLADLILRDTTDFDKLGYAGEGRYADIFGVKDLGDKEIKPGDINLDDLSKYELSPALQKKSENLLDSAFPEELPSQEEVLAEANQQVVENREVLDRLDRKKRREQAVESLVTNVVSTPIYTRLLEDAARRRLELDKAMLGAREMMPSNIQNIMASKQAQRSLASSAFAEELKAVAAQQDAATKFAGLGMQRAFGRA